MSPKGLSPGRFLEEVRRVRKALHFEEGETPSETSEGYVGLVGPPTWSVSGGVVPVQGPRPPGGVQDPWLDVLCVSQGTSPAPLKVPG